MLMVVVLCLSASSGYAQGLKVLNVTNLNKDTDYLLEHDEGVWRVTPMVLINLGEPVPVDEDVPEAPIELTVIGNEAKDLAIKHNVDKSICAEIAAVYREVSTRDATLKDSYKAIRTATDLILQARGVKEDLAVFRRELGEQVIAPRAKTDTFHKKHFGEIADGLQSYAGNRLIDIGDIIQVTVYILKKVRSGEELSVEDIVFIVTKLLD